MDFLADIGSWRPNDPGITWRRPMERSVAWRGVADKQRRYRLKSSMPCVRSRRRAALDMGGLELERKKNEYQLAAG
jgi:hypothetical protein